MIEVFTLNAELSDGFRVDLPGEYATEASAQRAAGVYMRDYSDPCGLGVHVHCVAIRRTLRPARTLPPAAA